jgi:hypothetical protein
LTPGDTPQTKEPLCITQGGFFVPVITKQTRNGENNYLPAKRGFLRVSDATKHEANTKFSGKGDKTHSYKTKRRAQNVNR